MTQRDYIIDRATQMFVSQGIKSVRMDDIAQSLGVSKRTLYEMFGDKEELIYLVRPWSSAVKISHRMQFGRILQVTPCRIFLCMLSMPDGQRIARSDSRG